MKKILRYTTVLLLFTISSCETEEGYEDFTVIESNATALSGDWYVQASVGGTIIADYFLITTSNTQSNSNSAIQIYDHENFWWFNAAVPANIQGLTFEGSDLESIVDDYEIKVNVSNGTIVKDGTVTSDTNKVADSIAFDIEFSDDPGTIYHLEGFRRSGFLEDEH